MSQVIEQIDLPRLRTPAAIVAELPRQPYNELCQPEYDDPTALETALQQVQHTEAPTTPEHICALRSMLGKIALGQDLRMVVIAGRCAEPLDGMTSQQVIADSLAMRQAVQNSISPAPLFILRSGNNAKPRSNATEHGVASHMGELVNAASIDRRDPDPARLPRAAVRAREVEAGLSEALASHQWHAHEALLLPYEHARLATMPDGRELLLSADLPWIGARTNSASGAHAEMLSRVENVVGIKIDDSSTPEHIAALARKLNPYSIPGKLAFMLRLPPGKTARLHDVMDALASHAPNAIILYDIHGATRSMHGHKIRALPEIAGQICEMAGIARQHGLRLHGIHVEATGDTTRRECTETPDELPTHSGGIDPQLNPNQLSWLVRQVAHCFENKESTI